jgi:hypothetical protein
LVKLSDAKNECKALVREYRRMRKHDATKFPNFLVTTNSESAKFGKVHLYQKERGAEPVVSDTFVAYDSIPELALVIENLGKEWSRQNERI